MVKSSSSRDPEKKKRERGWRGGGPRAPAGPSIPQGGAAPPLAGGAGPPLPKARRGAKPPPCRRQAMPFFMHVLCIFKRGWGLPPPLSSVLVGGGATTQPGEWGGKPHPLLEKLIKYAQNMMKSI